MFLLTLMNIDKDVCETTLGHKSFSQRVSLSSSPELFFFFFLSFVLCSIVNMDHCVCLHFCERVHISFLSPKWMIYQCEFRFY